ncbi:MAG: hypothetical protein LBP19_04325 [Treponema sp.]|jgi:sulfur relay (sulfurtransferase) DsrF/TusC family protein|nr:hypothetical protein [Treponema sp.]
MRNYVFFLFVLSSLIFFPSCSCKQRVDFAVDDGILYGFSKKSAAGIIPLAKTDTAAFSFETPAPIPANSSFELTYTARGPFTGAITLHIESAGNAPETTGWELPLDVSLITGQHPDSIRFAAPVNAPNIQKFTISVTREGKVPKEEADSFLEIKAARVRKRWFGFSWEETAEEKIAAVTPFVWRDSTQTEHESWIINPPESFRSSGQSELSAAALYDTAIKTGREDTITVEPGEIFFEWTAPHKKGNFLSIPSGMFPPNPYPIRVSVSSRMGTVKLEASPQRAFPLVPIPADPGIVLAYREGEWRDNRYEVFQWSGFPSLLIFDTVNYQAQDRLFKRLAFFVEKAEYRGRLVPDQELEGQHGWNAHDYRAEDLAAFFDRAETTRFPLLQEEQELRDILFANGILTREKNGAIRAGSGAVISLSRESSDALRAQFMAHEGFHGLFFIDEGFRAFTKNRYDALAPVARNFIRSFFDYQHYDITDSYLVLNEFQAYVLQQAAHQSYWYFGGNLAARLEASPWRRAMLPKKDESSGTWPDIGKAFQTEANAFSAYVQERWGFSAGRNWRVKVR